MESFGLLILVLCAGYGLYRWTKARSERKASEGRGHVDRRQPKQHDDR